MADERVAIRERLEQIRVAVEAEFPMSEAEVTALLAALSRSVLEISAIER